MRKVAQVRSSTNCRRLNRRLPRFMGNFRPRSLIDHAARALGPAPPVTALLMEDDLTLRATSGPGIIGTLSGLLFLALPGCDRLKRTDAGTSGKERTEVKRQQAACASASANARLKDSIFDEAIAERNGDRADLDTLADYSVARMENPVVKGWDSGLDITRCEGRFILEVPPGAERAFAGERQLQADLEYTAQASADGAGYVYKRKGADAIVSQLAAFRLSPIAYRPPPAIDNPQAPTSGGAQEVQVADAGPQQQVPGTTQHQPRPYSVPQPVPSPSRSTTVAPNGGQRRAPRQTPPAANPNSSAPGEATVRAFYAALGAGDGNTASLQVIPEKRSSGAFSPGAISRFYGHLPQPLRLTGIDATAGGAYRVTYRYSAGRSRCNGSAVVRLTQRGGRNFIRSIQALSGC